MKKLSVTQQKLYNKVKSTIAVIEKYETHEDFFNNSKYEQNTFTTAEHCNSYYNSSEKYKKEDPKAWERMEEDFYKAKNEHITIVFAKTETVLALEKAGLIEIIKKADYENDAEVIKLL